MDLLLEKITKYLEQEPRVCAAYLMGSRATGKNRPDSDLDIALLPSKDVKLTDLDRANISAELSYQTGFVVDAGILSSANLVYAKEAIFTGKQIFVNDEIFAGIMTASLLGMYVVFNEQRSEVLRAYQA